MSAEDTPIEFTIPNEWRHLTKPRKIIRLLQHQVIDLRESEFLEDMDQYDLVSRRQAEWLHKISERVYLFELQHLMDPPDREDFDSWVEQATKALNEDKSLGTNFGDWLKRK